MEPMVDVWTMMTARHFTKHITISASSGEKRFVPPSSFIILCRNSSVRITAPTRPVPTPLTQLDFDGHSKQATHNVNAYSFVYGPSCFKIGASKLPTSGFAEVYESNICILGGTRPSCMDLGQTSLPPPDEFKTRVGFGNNTIYAPNGNCTVEGIGFPTFAAFQAAGYETLPSALVSDAQLTSAMIIDMGRNVLNDPSPP